MKILKSALELGATMYMPATHSELWDVTQGYKYPELKSIVVCLEDSVRQEDLTLALSNLKQLLNRIHNTVVKNDRVAVFVRPRNLEVAKQIVDWGLNHCFNGFVVPKFVLEDIQQWHELTLQQKNVMLTLETGEYFDMGYVSEAKHALNSINNRNILCLRIGGNDLLSSLNLRRPKHCTIYDTPVGLLIPQLVGQFVPSGYQLSSPVFEHIENIELLKKEIALDKVNGLLAKTAIHPDQLALIHNEYKVSSNEYYEAQLILDANAKSVFKVNGSMLEPATHRNWAEHILLRSKLYGVADTHLQITNHSFEQDKVAI